MVIYGRRDEKAVPIVLLNGQGLRVRKAKTIRKIKEKLKPLQILTSCFFKPCRLIKLHRFLINLHRSLIKKQCSLIKLH